jgi:hypothetical protein
MVKQDHRRYTRPQVDFLCRQAGLDAVRRTFKEAEYIEYRVPRQCHEEFGQDLDGCSRQENQGCKGCKCLIIVKGEN